MSDIVEDLIMPVYIVCYTIPRDTIFEAIVSDRSEDYQAIYDKLDEIGRRILTSTYLVDHEGNAAGLLNYLLADLPADLTDRIEFLISEISANLATFPPDLLSRAP